MLEKAPDVPIVILSGQDDEALAIKALHQGVQDYLVKGTFTSAGLDRAMRYAVERQALLRSLEMSRKQQLGFKNQFLSHVSHELRTPLTCIHQFVTILLDGLAGAVSVEQRDHLATILKSVNQLGAMVRDLLEASRAEAGKISVEPHCVVLGDLIRLAVSMMRAAAREKQVGLEIGVDTRIPFVYGDPDRILEVLINLIDNSIKFTPSGGCVTVQACLAPTDPDFVYVSVADTGCGIDPKAKALIFERLYQDPNSIDNSRKGLGLGLFIAKELVTLQGGRIWVASEPGHGSTFSFTLPLSSLGELLFAVIQKTEPARGHRSGQGQLESAVQPSSWKLERDRPTPPGAPATVRLPRQGRGPASDDNFATGADFFRGCVHRSGARGNHDDAHSRAVGETAGPESELRTRNLGLRGASPRSCGRPQFRRAGTGSRRPRDRNGPIGAWNGAEFHANKMRHTPAIRREPGNGEVQCKPQKS